MAKKIETIVHKNENVKPVIEHWVRNSQGANDVGIKSRWWFVEDEDIYKHVNAVAQAIDTNQQYRETSYIRYARLYSNMELLGLNGYLFNRSNNDHLLTNRITLNVVKSCVDTAASKIAKSTPKPIFLTEDGDYFLQMKAKKLTQYVQGLFDEGNFNRLAQQIFTDGCVFGLGAIKIYAENNKICFDRVLPNEILVDDAEGTYAKPRQMHQKKNIARELLIDLFPDHAEKIIGATSSVRGEISSRSSADYITVVESWHLPSGPESGDGKHTICIDNCTLFSEEYKKDYFPFVFFRWSDRLIGFYGQGLAEELVGIQIEINRLLKNIQQAQHLMAVPRIFVENSSNVTTSHLSNDIGSVIKYTGNAPIFTTAPAMSPEVYRHLENLYSKAYQITGISQLSAQSSKPAGLNSGAALREFSDIESERFLLVGSRFTQLFLDAAEIAIDISRDLYADDRDLKVKVKGKKFIDTIPWSEVDMDNDKFSMGVFPVSLLPHTPAGRLQTVQELTQAGFLSKEQALSLLDFPDLESVTTLETADLDDTKMLIANMIEKGEYTSPEPFMNLQMAIKLTQSSYLKAKTQKVPEDRLELLRNFIVDCQTLLQAATQPPALEQPALIEEQNPQQAMPEAQPTSDLLPQV